jgi:hypothetical protein
VAGRADDGPVEAHRPVGEGAEGAGFFPSPCGADFFSEGFADDFFLKAAFFFFVKAFFL